MIHTKRKKETTIPNAPRPSGPATQFGNRRLRIRTVVGFCEYGNELLWFHKLLEISLPAGQAGRSTGPHVQHAILGRFTRVHFIIAFSPPPIVTTVKMVTPNCCQHKSFSLSVSPMRGGLVAYFSKRNTSINFL